MSDDLDPWIREFAARADRAPAAEMPGPDLNRRCESCNQPLPNEALARLNEITDRLRSGHVTWMQLYDALGIEGSHLHHVLAGRVPLDEETAGRLLAAGGAGEDAIDELDVPDPAPKLAQIASQPRRFTRKSDDEAR